MLKLLQVLRNQGYQAIRNVRSAAVNEAFRGFPEINKKACKDGCKACVALCPAKAIKNEPVTVDLGKCIFCGDCERECPVEKIHFTNFHKISATSEEALRITEEINYEAFYKDAIKVSSQIKSMFGRSLKLRQVSAAGCNGCEMELNACGNVNFDMGRFGIEFVASPRHADGIVITGPISENMAAALQDTYNSTPDPKIIVLTGTCAISGGLFSESEALDRSFMKTHKPDLYIPGCPVHPLTVINGILDFLGRK